MLPKQTINEATPNVATNSFNEQLKESCVNPKRFEVFHLLFSTCLCQGLQRISVYMLQEM